VHTLCNLDLFVSRNGIVVIPVVALLDDASILDGLRASPSEVAHIFDHPLEALLDPELARKEALVPLGSVDWPYEAELYVRMFVVLIPRIFVPFSSLLFSSNSKMNYQNFTDAPWLGSTYRIHRFRSTAPLVKGLAADILVGLLISLPLACFVWLTDCPN
jgi:peroxisomal coenzyme A diphosphatase NUDT7